VDTKVASIMVLLLDSESFIRSDPTDPAIDRLRRIAAVLEIICRVEEVSGVDDDVAALAAEDVLVLLLLPCCFNTIILLARHSVDVTCKITTVLLTSE
jgi:hypothetical protein